MDKINLLTRKQVAEMLGVSEGTLAVWTCTKRYNLKYIKVGRCVKYRLSDVLDFLDQRTQNNNTKLSGK